MAIRFSYFKLDRDRGLDCVFGISSSLTVVAIGILFSKFLSSVNMECGNEISSSEDKFDLSLLNDEISAGPQISSDIKKPIDFFKTVFHR